ncbi:Peptidase C15 [Macleaya cordata]|uniref:Peptidase C15 n=1 Tax=Macleaya cordata TaxID=56857 RepID=A0A200R2S3_MACCD|nr:Peptidase C15 [Macleaya cordata]
MGSEGPVPVTVHVTGFSKFHGVPDNPTETIVSNLKGFLKRRGLPLPGGISVGSCTILDAAGDGSLPMLYEIMKSSISNSEPFADSLSNEQVVWLHFGVSGGSTEFAIERQAVNEATFRCPDEHGWQPQQLPIVPEDGGTSHTRQTSCAVDVILKQLKKKGFDVVISDDADRFVCNYIYYHSLRFAEQKGHKSLFVHVPLFSRIDEDTQMEFAASLLEALSLNH